MSKAQVVPPSAGGAGGMVGFKKLWEGDLHLTGSKTDITDGAVNAAEYHVLFVHYTGHIVPTGQNFYGIGGAGTNTHYDFSSKTNVEKDVDITRLMVGSAVGGWVRLNHYGNAPDVITNPFLFGVASNSSGNVASFTANFHFTVYGMKL